MRSSEGPALTGPRADWGSTTKLYIQWRSEHDLQLPTIAAHPSSPRELSERTQSSGAKRRLKYALPRKERHAYTKQCRRRKECVFCMKTVENTLLRPAYSHRNFSNETRLPSTNRSFCNQRNIGNRFDLMLRVPTRTPRRDGQYHYPRGNNQGQRRNSWHITGNFFCQKKPRPQPRRHQAGLPSKRHANFPSNQRHIRLGFDRRMVPPFTVDRSVDSRCI